MTEALPEYYEFTFRVPDESREAVANKIMELGSPGFFERNGDIVAYFEYRPDIKGLCDELDNFRDVLKASGLDDAFSFEFTLIPGKDWNESWKKGFKPIDVGDNLTIVPSWIKPDTDRIALIIDPGMAFGTGHHETTKRCLMLIESLARANKGKSFLDIGTGTGILAICAARLGFGQVTGMDTDQLAVDAATYNASLNGFEIVINKGGISEVEGPFDVIAANLISETLVLISGDIASRLNHDGTAILSGMIKGQEDDVTKATEDAGLILKEKIEDGKWVTLIFSRLPSSSQSVCRCRETC